MSTHEREERLSTADVAAAGREGGPEREPRREAVEREESRGEPRPGRPEEESAPLFSEQEAHELRSHWSAIQTGFVDEPRRAVEAADSLVAQAIKRLAETFAEERRHLEEQWSRGDNVSTEDLRVALQRYRSFFDRLLSV